MRSSRKKKPDPFREHAWYYLAIRCWHVSFDGPTWQRKDIPHTDWRGGPDWIEHQYELEHQESLNLRLVVEPYRRSFRVGSRDITVFDFRVWSSADPGGGLLEICPDGELRGWMHLPLSGVQALLALLIAGRTVILEVHGSLFKRGTALIHSNSGWSTEGHPSLEDELS